MSVIDDVIAHLTQQQASMRCAEMKKLLETLGFQVTDAATKNHKLVYHKGIKDFHGSHYDCGHGKNPELKKPYVQAMRRLIEKYRIDLANHLGLSNDSRS